MKSLKLSIIAAFLAIALINTANADGSKIQPQKKIIYMTFVQAMQVPALVSAMHQQLNPGFLSTNQWSYSIDVAYQGYIVRISGSYLQWKLFFNVNIKDINSLKAVPTYVR